jgi:hypothetical protein
MEGPMKVHILLAAPFFVLAPATAMAESQEEQMACMNDAFTMCSYAIPDRERVGACLAENIRRISLACRTVMLRYSKPPNRRTRITPVRDN